MSSILEKVSDVIKQDMKHYTTMMQYLPVIEFIWVHAEEQEQNRFQMTYNLNNTLVSWL